MRTILAQNELKILKVASFPGFPPSPAGIQHFSTYSFLVNKLLTLIGRGGGGGGGGLFKCTIVMLSFAAFNSCAILEEKQGAWVRGYTKGTFLAPLITS